MPKLCAIITLGFLFALTSSVSAQETDEVTRIQTHLTEVESHLRSTDVSDWSPERQAARSQTIQYLREYRQDGVFPRNVDFPQARVPYFFDDRGVACAVAHLMVETGYEVEARSISTRENNGWVMEMTSPEVGPWLEVAGITAEEASWIQPTYGFCDQVFSEISEAPATANCGDEVQLVAREVNATECPEYYAWTVSGEPAPTLVPDGSVVTVQLPEVTPDGAEYVIGLQVSNQGWSETSEHTLTVSCVGEPQPDPEPGIDDQKGDVTCSSVGTTADGGGVLLLSLLALIGFRRRP